VSYDELSSFSRPSESSRDIAERVVRARQLQAARFEAHPSLHCNAQMPGQMVREVCQVNPTGLMLVKKAMEKLQLSARAFDRILKVSRTIADLADSPDIQIEHLAEAIHFRSLDREGWAG